MANALKKSYISFIQKIIWMGGLVLFIFLVSSKLLFVEFLVPSDSMDPAIKKENNIWVNKIGFHTYFSLWGKDVRFNGFRQPNKGNIIAFHFPEGDTVLLNNPEKDYYLEKELRELNPHKDTLVYLPIGSRPNYVKRLIGMPGDTLYVKDGNIYINHEIQNFSFPVRHLYRVYSQIKYFKNYILNTNIFERKKEYVLCSLLQEDLKVLKSNEQIDSVVCCHRFRACRYYFPLTLDKQNDWDAYNFGPIIIPKKGTPLLLSSNNLDYYKRLINVYEKSKIMVQNDSVYLNGKLSSCYVPTQDYYFVMGDNRDISIDSRNWGFVPYDHIIGTVFYVR